MSRPIRIAGFRLDKSGKLIRSSKHLDASARQRQRPGGSKKIRAVRRQAK
jgi:hypothetical protein